MTRTTKLVLLAGAAALAAGGAAANSDKDRAEAKTGMHAGAHASLERARDADMRTTIGATVGQIDDADLIAADGAEIGDVEAVLLNDAGEASSVLVKLDRQVAGEDRDSRYVRLDLAELTTREDDDFVNLWDERIDLVSDRSPEVFTGMERWTYIAPEEAGYEVYQQSAAADAAAGQRAEMREARFERAADRSALTSLGVTVGQIDDADIVNTEGEEYGEVEAVLANEAGEPVSALIELETEFFERERLIEVDLAEFTTREDDDYLNLWDDRIDLVTDQPIEHFEAMEDWRYAGPQERDVSARAETEQRAEAD